MIVPDKPPMSAGPALSLETSAGVIAFFGGPPRPVADATVILRFTTMSSGGREGATFDEAERDALSPNFMTSVSTMSFGSGGGVGFGTGQMVETFEAAVPAPGRAGSRRRPSPAGDAAHRHASRRSGRKRPATRMWRHGHPPGGRHH